jgi:hypothetical protein
MRAENQTAAAADAAAEFRPIGAPGGTYGFALLVSPAEDRLCTMLDGETIAIYRGLWPMRIISDTDAGRMPHPAKS